MMCVLISPPLLAGNRILPSGGGYFGFRTADRHVTPIQQDGFTVENVDGTSGTSVPITIALPDEIRGETARPAAPKFILIRGLPEALKLSVGFRTKNAWAVSFKDAQHLELFSPSSYRGAFIAEVILHTGTDGPPVTRQISISLQPADAAAVAITAPAGLSPRIPSMEISPPPDVSSLPDAAQKGAKRLNHQEATALLEKGMKLLLSGNLASARLLFNELVRQNDVRGAFAMGQSYDPEVLRSVLVVGVSPDMEAAKRWYRKAAELGSADARSRLSALSSEASQ
jgi:hypothetical protein